MTEKGRVTFKGSGRIRNFGKMRIVDRSGVQVGSEEELRAALADPDVSKILVTGAVTIANPASVNDVSLTIDRPVTVTGGGSIASEESSGAAITFIRITSPDVTLKDITVKHRKLSPTTNDRAILLQADGFVSDGVDLEFAEFGYWMEGSFLVERGSTTYTGPLGNTHRHFGLYSLTADSTVREHTFDFPFEPAIKDVSAPRSAFMLSTQGVGRKFNGKLTLDGVRQKTVSTSLTDSSEHYYMHQFFNQGAFAADPSDRTGMALEFKNCEWDDFSGGAFIFNGVDNPLDQYVSITLTDNVQGIGTLIDSSELAPVGDPSQPGRFKGMFFVDGSAGTRTLGDASVLTMSGNVVPGVSEPGDTLRPEYAFLNPTGQQSSVFAYKTAAFAPTV